MLQECFRGVPSLFFWATWIDCDLPFQLYLWIDSFLFQHDQPLFFDFLEMNIFMLIKKLLFFKKLRKRTLMEWFLKFCTSESFGVFIIHPRLAPTQTILIPLVCGVHVGLRLIRSPRVTANVQPRLGTAALVLHSSRCSLAYMLRNSLASISAFP